MMATGSSGRTINIQVKSTYQGYDWLVANKFEHDVNSVVAFVRLGKDATRQPELYFLSAARANELITHKYENHSPRISHADVQKEFQDHNFEFIERTLEK